MYSISLEIKFYRMERELTFTARRLCAKYITLFTLPTRPLKWNSTILTATSPGHGAQSGDTTDPKAQSQQLEGLRRSVVWLQSLGFAPARKTEPPPSQFPKILVLFQYLIRYQWSIAGVSSLNYFTVANTYPKQCYLTSLCSPGCLHLVNLKTSWFLH